MRQHHRGGAADGDDATAALRSAVHEDSDDYDDDDDEGVEQMSLLTSGASATGRHRRRSDCAWQRWCQMACAVVVGLAIGHTLADHVFKRPAAATTASPTERSAPSKASSSQRVATVEAVASPPPPPPVRKLGPPPRVDPSKWKHVLNESLAWVEETVPHFECADADVTLTYWYRWRLFHLHMRRGDKLRACSSPAEGCWVVTEFLHKVFWSGAHNTIVAPAGHHMMEGRWLRDASVIDDYARFWFLGQGWRKQYTFWPAYALWQRSLLLQRRGAAEGITAELFPLLADNYRDWQRTHYAARAGCIFQSCHADGQENSAGLDGCRPTITAVMFGEASALAAIAAALRNTSESAFFAAEAAKWQRVLEQRLWDPRLKFFVTEAQPPPPNLHQELQRMNRLKRSREVQTYFGCLACDRKRTCPPERGWPQGKRVTVRARGQSSRRLGSVPQLASISSSDGT